MSKVSQNFLGDFIYNEFQLPQNKDGAWEDICPGDLQDTILRLEFSYSHVDKACEAARKAYLGWATKTLKERKEYVNRLKEVYIAHTEELANAIARDTGKPLWEATGEAKAMIGKIDITLNESLKLVENETLENLMPNVDGVIRYRPRGVMAVLGPFNFPGHLPNGHIVPALVTGNTVVFKPSEQTPFVGQVMAEMFQKAEFPPGVFNLIQGNGEVGRRLTVHEEVSGILFTGSYDVGLKIQQATMDHYWKILALEMGGKNTSIVWKDTDLDKALFENVFSSFITAGQRCSCSSRLVVHEDIYDEFVDRFYKLAKKLEVGHWRDNPFMGPLINESAVQKYVRFQGIAKREGAECLMRGKELDRNPEGYYVSPSIYLVDEVSSDSTYQKAEIFGPNVAIFKTSSLEESIEAANRTGYGLVMSVFSKDKSLYEKANILSNTGLLNWNKSTAGASSRLPFGGTGKSGNDRPSAHFAVQYCTVPVANLEDRGEFDSSKLVPGMSWE